MKEVLQVSLLNGEGPILSIYNDKCIGAKIKEQYGLWEFQNTAILLGMCSSLPPLFGKINFIDIGAHVGYFSLLIGSRFPNVNVYAFEPDKNSFDLLKKNTQDFDNISVYNVAISDKSGVSDFFYCDDFENNTGAGSLLEEEMIKTQSLDANFNYKKTQTKTSTIDNFNIDLSLFTIIKVDTQNTEEVIIDSLSKILPQTFMLLTEKFPNVQDCFNKNKISFMGATPISVWGQRIIKKQEG